MKNNSFEIGKINNTHGIKGSLKVTSLTDFDRFKINKKIYYLENNKKHFLTISQVNYTNKFLILNFKEITNINDALSLKNKILYTDEVIKTNDIHYDDLINLNVIDENNTYIGYISNIIFNPSQSVLEITNKEKRILVPFVKDFIKGISKNKELIINIVEGLL